MKIRYRYVFNRKKRLNARGEALVQIEASLGRRKAYFGTGIYVKPSEWDGSEVVCRDDATMLNGMLAEHLVSLHQTEAAVWRQGQKPSLTHLRADWRRERSTMNVLRFAEEMVEASGRAVSTKRNIMSTVHLLDAFRSLELHELDYGVLRGFETFLRGRGNQPGTIKKHFRNLRTVCNEAVRRGLLQRGELAFSEIRISDERKPHTVLGEGELKRLAGVDAHHNVRDAFLFCCHTGLRYSDYRRLDESCWRVDDDGRRWMELRMKKTGGMVRLPMTEIEGLLGACPPHPAIGSDGDVNKKLGELCRIAGIEKHVTFHVARHTFATRLLGMGVPVTTVQVLLGHSSVRVTQRYAETKRQTVVDDLRRAASATIDN